MSASLDDLPEGARIAWLRLLDELREILGEDLVAMWAYGSTIVPERPLRPADLDTHVIVKRRPDKQNAQRIEDASGAITEDEDVEWDAWFIVLDDARRAEPPPHAYRDGRRDTSWALHRAHWLAGQYLHLHGQEPAEIVPAPTWAELEADLDRELEHIERHVLEGDTDPYEAAYAILNGSRVLHAIETRDVVLSNARRVSGRSTISPSGGTRPSVPPAGPTTPRRPLKMPNCLPPKWRRSWRWSGEGCQPPMNLPRKLVPAGRDTDVCDRD
jgi:hypothetical protein